MDDSANRVHINGRPCYVTYSTIEEIRCYTSAIHNLSSVQSKVVIDHSPEPPAPLQLVVDEVRKGEMPRARLRVSDCNETGREGGGGKGVHHGERRASVWCGRES